MMKLIFSLFVAINLVAGAALAQVTGPIGGGGGGGVPAAVAPLNLANYVTATQLTAATTSTPTNATTAAGNGVLHFAATPSWVAVGSLVVDLSGTNLLLRHTTVVSFDATTVTVTPGAVAPGIGSGDQILFVPDMHTQIAAWLAACSTANTVTPCALVVPPGWFYDLTCNQSIANPFSMTGAGARSAYNTAGTNGGAGEYVSVLSCGTDAVKFFSVTSTYGLVRSISFVDVAQGTATSGSSAFLVTSVNNGQVSFEDIQTDGFYDAIDSATNQGWHLSYSNIQNPVHWGVRVRNTTADAGDWTIVSNTFWGVGYNAAIRWESSGNGHIYHNAIIGSATDGIQVETTPGGSIEIVIEGNKIEGMTGVPVAVYSGWPFVNIVGNTLRQALSGTTATGITASYTGSVMTVSAIGAGSIKRGMAITCAGCPKGLYIKSIGGLANTYNMNLTVQNTISSTMTGTMPSIICNLCSSLVISGNNAQTTPTALGPAIILDGSSGTVGVNDMTGTTPMLLSNSSLINYNGTQCTTYANAPDPQQLAAGSTGCITDATTPVMGQPFISGGKLQVKTYADNGRWLSAQTVLAQDYIGPGDVKPGAFAWWSATRAYSAAKIGTNAIEVCNTSAGDGSCTNITTLANGQIDLTAIKAVPCLGTLDCTVRTVYDQTGGGNCTGSCNMVQATSAQRPRVAFPPLGTCATPVTSVGMCLFQAPNAANSTVMLTAGVGTIGATYTIVGMAAHTSAFGTDYNAIVTSTTGGMYYAGGVNQLDCIGAVDHFAPATDNQWHYLMCLSNGASSFAIVDGTQTSYTNATALSATQLALFSDNVVGAFDNLKGFFTEGGIWASAFSNPADINNVTANMRAYYQAGN